MIWYDEARIGGYLPQMNDPNVLPSNTRSNTVGGGVMVCPEHPDGGRSYTMNFWAASAGSWRLNNGRVQSFKPGSSTVDPGQEGLAILGPEPAVRAHERIQAGRAEIRFVVGVASAGMLQGEDRRG